MRKKLVQDADFLLQKGLSRPIVYHLRAATLLAAGSSKASP
jgi:hypothetical protein